MRLMRSAKSEKPEPLFKSDSLKQFEKSFPAHSGTPEKVLDNENGDFVIGGNYKRPDDARLCVNQMVPALPVEDKSISLEDLCQL